MKKFKMDFQLGNKDLEAGDCFLWRGSQGFEVHCFHSDSGYGVKTYTNYDEKDGSSTLVNWSGVCGKIIVVDCKEEEEEEEEVEKVEEPRFQRECKHSDLVWISDGKHLNGEIGYDILTCSHCNKTF